MRFNYLAVAAPLLVAACTTAPAPETEVGLRGEASASCVVSDEWAYAVNRGQFVYEENCDYCHQDNGTGQAGTVPALAGNATVLSDPARGVRLILVTKDIETRMHGMAVEDLVAIFDDLTEADIADVLTYARASWGNCEPPISEAYVRSIAAGS